jgi:hypothetical protein
MHVNKGSAATPRNTYASVTWLHTYDSYRINTPPVFAFPRFAETPRFSRWRRRTQTTSQYWRDSNIGQVANMQQLNRHLQASCQIGTSSKREAL